MGWCLSATWVAEGPLTGRQCMADFSRKARRTLDLSLILDTKLPPTAQRLWATAR
jgi:hypothetical protein